MATMMGWWYNIQRSNKSGVPMLALEMILVLKRSNIVQCHSGFV